MSNFYFQYCRIIIIRPSSDREIRSDSSFLKRERILLVDSFKIKFPWIQS